jgi:hypothetical protein
VKALLSTSSWLELQMKLEVWEQLIGAENLFYTLHTKKAARHHAYAAITNATVTAYIIRIFFH